MHHHTTRQHGASPQSQQQQQRHRRAQQSSASTMVARCPGRAAVLVSASHHSTAQKAAAVRELQKQTHASRAHWLQQEGAARRAAVERSLAFQTLTPAAPQRQQQQQHQHQHQHQQHQQHHQQPGWPVRPEPRWQHERQQHEQQWQAEQPQQQQQQQRAHVASAPPFTQLLHAVDMLVRSHSLADWRQATLLLQHSLVPLVSSPLQAHQAWVCISRLAVRPLKGQTARLLAAALVGLVQVSLAHNDHNILQRLVAASSAPPGSAGALRISLSPRHVHDLVAAAADAGADGPTLRALLDLAPACQLSSRAYFAALATAVNRGHASEALACANKWQDTGLRATPALSRLLALAKPGGGGGVGGGGVAGGFTD